MSATVEACVQRSKEIDEGVKDFFDAVNWVLQRIPGTPQWLLKTIVDAMDALRRTISEFWEQVTRIFAQAGDSDKLEAYAAVLVEQVAKPLGDIAGNVGMDKLDTTTAWTGGGAEAYKAIVPAQGGGLEDLQDLANELGNTLKEVANGIENFWLAVSLAFAALVVSIVTAIAEAGSIVLIPLSAETIAVGVGIALAAITTAVVELKSIYDTMDTAQDTISQSITKLGDEWAKATPKNQARIDTPDTWRPVDAGPPPPRVRRGAGPVPRPPAAPSPPGPPPPQLPDLPPLTPVTPIRPALPVDPPGGPFPKLPGIDDQIPPPVPPPGLATPPYVPPVDPPPRGTVPPPDEDPPPRFDPVAPPVRLDPPDVDPPRRFDPPNVDPPILFDPPDVDPPSRFDPVDPGSRPRLGDVDTGTRASSFVPTEPAGFAASSGLSGGTDASAARGGGGVGGVGGVGVSGMLGAPVVSKGAAMSGNAARGGVPTGGPASGNPAAQAGVGGVPLAGAGKGEEDKEHKSKWRVEGSLFDEEEADPVATFTGIVGRDPAQAPKKRS